MFFKKWDENIQAAAYNQSSDFHRKSTKICLFK